MNPARIHLIRTYFPHLAKHSGLIQFIKYLDGAKIEITENPVPMGTDRSRGRIFNKAELYALRQWWRGRFDILHYLDGEHSLRYLSGLFRRLGFLRRKPFVMATFNQPPDILTKSINIKIVRQLDHITVLTPEQFDYFAQYFPANKISLILHGVDTNFYHPDKGSRNGKFKCLSVGHWLRDYDTVFKVAEMLQSQENIEFHIVSPGANPPSRLKNIFIHTGISDDALLKMYQNAGLLFLPLLKSTANNAILEGIACGLPTVTTDLVSTRTYLPRDEARFVSQNDPRLFAQAILTLYRDAELRARMSLSARRRALELSWRNISRQYEDLYLKLANA